MAKRFPPGMTTMTIQTQNHSSVAWDSISGCVPVLGRSSRRVDDASSFVRHDLHLPLRVGHYHGEHQSKQLQTLTLPANRLLCHLHLLHQRQKSVLGGLRLDRRHSDISIILHSLKWYPLSLLWQALLLRWPPGGWPVAEQHPKPPGRSLPP